MTNALATLDLTKWTEYFNIKLAYMDVINYVAALPSSKTKTKHTLRVYQTGLDYWRQWSMDTLPTPELMTLYIAHLKNERQGRDGMGLKSSTISSKYLAPLRHYLTKLANQSLPGLHGPERDFVADCREAMRQALAIKNPRPDTTTNQSALYAHGERLSLAEVNTVLTSIDPNTIIGKRDLALLYLGFTSGLRLSELSRVTLAKIKHGENCWEVHVRGKRNNIDPVPIDTTAKALIEDYVDAYNRAATIPIEVDSPIWQAHHNSGSIFTDHPTSRGLSTSAIQNIVSRRTNAAIGRAITPHDMRRTVAAIARANNMDYDDIRALLRHKSIATTARYVGKPQNLSRSLLTSRGVAFDLPRASGQ